MPTGWESPLSRQEAWRCVQERHGWMKGPGGQLSPTCSPALLTHTWSHLFIGKVPLCLKQDPVASWSCQRSFSQHPPPVCPGVASAMNCLFFIVQLTCFSEGAGNFLSQEQGKKNLSLGLTSHCLKVWGFSHKTQYLIYKSCQGTSWKKGSVWVRYTIQKGQFPLVSRTGEVRLSD